MAVSAAVDRALRRPPLDADDEMAPLAPPEGGAPQELWTDSFGSSNLGARAPPKAKPKRSKPQASASQGNARKQYLCGTLPLAAKAQFEFRRVAGVDHRSRHRCGISTGAEPREAFALFTHMFTSVSYTHLTLPTICSV